MASDLDLIMGGYGSLGQLPTAVAQTKQYNAQYGNASPEEMQASEVLKRIAMGEDPAAIAKDHATRKFGGQGGLGGAPLGGAVPSLASGRVQSPVSPGAAQGLGSAGSVVGPMAGQYVSPPSPAMEEVMAASTPYRGDVQSRGVMDLQPAMSRQSVQQTPKTRDELARLNDVYGRISKERQINATITKAERPPQQRDYMAELEYKRGTELIKEEARAKNMAERLNKTLTSREGIASMSRALKEAGLEFDRDKWDENLRYLYAALQSREGIARIHESGSAEGRALKYVLGITGSLSGLYSRNPAFFAGKDAKEFAKGLQFSQEVQTRLNDIAGEAAIGELGAADLPVPDRTVETTTVTKPSGMAPPSKQRTNNSQLIRVRNKKTGQTGRIPASKFDSSKYDKVQ